MKTIGAIAFGILAAVLATSVLFSGEEAMVPTDDGPQRSPGAARSAGFLPLPLVDTDGGLGRHRASNDSPGEAPPSVLRQEQETDGPVGREEFLAARAAQAEQRSARIRDAFQSHWSQPVDAQWSRRARYDLWAGLEEPATRAGAAITQVDCRTTSCVVEARWAKYDDAVGSVTELLGAPFEPNCESVVQLEEPDEPNAEYTAHVLIDCDGTQGRGYSDPAGPS